MPIRERLISAVIGTPLQAPLEWFRHLSSLPQRNRHPELREICLEGTRASAIINRVIRPGMNCVDVGCHLGSVLSRIVRMSPTGRHIAIEPIPYKAHWLRRKFPGVTVHQVALGSTEGEVDFFVNTKMSGFSGLKVHGDLSDVKPLKVTRRLLDDIIPQEQKVGFLKIDVEGGEFDVFLGANRVLSADRPIIMFECTLSGLQAYNSTAKSIYDLMKSQHYHILLFKDYLAGNQPLDLAAFEFSQRYPFQAPRREHRRRPAAHPSNLVRDTHSKPSPILLYLGNTQDD